MIQKASKDEIRLRVHKRIRRKAKGSGERPRLAVYRSLSHIYAQVIDDVQGHTVTAASSNEKGWVPPVAAPAPVAPAAPAPAPEPEKPAKKGKGKAAAAPSEKVEPAKAEPAKAETPKAASGGNIAGARAIGRLIAQRAIEKGVRKVVFDRGGYLYHGRVKALAEAAREAGLEF